MSNQRLRPWTAMEWYRIEQIAHTARRAWKNYRDDRGRIGERRKAMEAAAILRTEANRILRSNGSEV